MNLNTHFIIYKHLIVKLRSILVSYSKDSSSVCDSELGEKATPS